MEGVGISHGMQQQQSPTVLERFYSNGGPLLSSHSVSLLQGMEGSEADTAVLQAAAREGEEGKNGVRSSLRSPIVGDLASPQHYSPSSSTSYVAISSTPAYVAIKPPPPPSSASSCRGYSTDNHHHHHHHPTIPTPSSSAAVEALAGSPSTPSTSSSSSSFPTAQSLDSSAAFLPHSLSELVGTSSSFSLSSSAQNDVKLSDVPPEPVICLWDNCHQEFPSLSSLVTHLDRAHTLAMTQFVCLWENCSRKLKPFDARYKLITHLRCHTGEKPYRCEVASCKRSFSRLENLKLHTRTHTGEKPYQCDYAGCTKRFNNTSDRAKHKKTHVTRKPYACKYPGCGKSYTDPSSMRKHIKYTHKLKEEAERTGLPLLSLPKRKRSSASSSSSSSNASSTPHTPKQPLVVLQTPPQAISTGHDPTASHHPLATPSSTSLLPLTTPSSTSLLPLTTPSPASVSTQAQLIPMVKIAGTVQATQQVLLPSNYQQQPVMMILANSTAPTANWVTMATTASSSSPQIQTTTSMSVPTQQKHSSLSGIPVGFSSDDQVRPQAPNSPPSSTSVEDQLRLQIAHLQQQLYQSQLAAARASQRQDGSIQAPVVASKSEGGEGRVVSVQQLPGLAQSAHQPLPALSTALHTENSPQSSMKQGPVLVASSPTVTAVLAQDKPGAAVHTQYIPILPPQDVNPPAQYLYMSP